MTGNRALQATPTGDSFYLSYEFCTNVQQNLESFLQLGQSARIETVISTKDRLLNAEPQGKLSRVERNQQVRKRLFEAAARVVAESGYAEASITRITDVAGVAQGTFYNHFESRQALLDELLPTLGMEMAQFIESRTNMIHPEMDREIARFRSFSEYLKENPGFHRILNEAEFAAPAGFYRHIDNMAGPSQHMLRRARGRGEVGDYTDAEIEVIAHVLMGACIQMSQRLGSQADETLFNAYGRLLQNGLFYK